MNPDRLAYGRTVTQRRVGPRANWRAIGEAVLFVAGLSLIVTAIAIFGDPR